jgi:hypothetical protein
VLKQHFDVENEVQEAVLLEDDEMASKWAVFIVVGKFFEGVFVGHIPVQRCYRNRLWFGLRGGRCRFWLILCLL